MKLQLKEPEVIAAITEYLSQQGIRTLNKDIAVYFTAGRKKSGLTAEIYIEDMQFDSSILPVSEPAPTPEEVAAFSEIPVVVIPEVIEPVKTTSLFS